MQHTFHLRALSLRPPPSVSLVSPSPSIMMDLILSAQTSLWHLYFGICATTDMFLNFIGVRRFSITQHCRTCCLCVALFGSADRYVQLRQIKRKITGSRNRLLFCRYCFASPEIEWNMFDNVFFAFNII